MIDSNFDHCIYSFVMLGENQLTGTIPSDIVLLNNLQYLDLGKFWLECHRREMPVHFIPQALSSILHLCYDQVTIYLQELFQQHFKILPAFNICNWVSFGLKVVEVNAWCGKHTNLYLILPDSNFRSCSCIGMARTQQIFYSACPFI